MIRHIVFFSAQRPGEIDDIIAGLSILKEIDAPLRLEISLNLKKDQFDNTVDVVVYGEFADSQALAAYKAHPLYQESIRRVRPIRELRLAADIMSAKGVE